MKTLDELIDEAREAFMRAKSYSLNEIERLYILKALKKERERQRNEA